MITEEQKLKLELINELETEGYEREYCNHLLEQLFLIMQNYDNNVVTSVITDNIDI